VRKGIMEKEIVARLKITQTRDVCICEISVTADHRPITKKLYDDWDDWFKTTTDFVTAIGQAKRSPEDKKCPEIGSYLAVGRALESAGQKFIRRGNGLVKHKEDMKNRILPPRKTPIKLERIKKFVKGKK
jgi:hypothetical protein